MTAQFSVGDVVQVSPECDHVWLRGSFVMVTEPKSFGLQGFCAFPGNKDEQPGRAFVRLKFDEVELIGKAKFIPGDLVDRDKGD